MAYDLLTYKDETDIQNTLRAFLEKEKFGPIIEELYLNKNSPLQKHQYVLVDKFLKYIEILNTNLWSSNLYKESKEQIIAIIQNNFLTKFDSYKTNQEIYNLIFGRDTRTITLTKLDGKKDELVSYKVVDTDYKTDCRNNEITIIKEKVIRVTPYSDDTQRPDFAVYLNGLPFIAVEVKNPLANIGLYEAFRDYKVKTTYHKFISCLCTDGLNAALTANPAGLTIDDWKAYGKHKTNRFIEENSGFFDFSEEILFQVKNFVFYFQYGIFPFEKNLGNLRVQQYYVMKAAFNLIARTPIHTSFREVVKQPPRSGKTIAIRSIINMLTLVYPNQYKKIFIQVPDLTIMGQFYKDFINFSFNHGFKVKMINRRRRDANEDSNNYSYEEAVLDNDKAIYIMNMQKISDDLADITNNNSDILVFIDEVHTHQLGENSRIRDINFPNASYITFTATTRKVVIDGKTVDLTSSEYSTSGKYLDELFNEDAKNLGMVVPVVYEKAKFDVVLNKDNAQTFSEYVNEQIIQKLYNEEKFSGVRDEIDRKVKEYVVEMVKKSTGQIIDDLDINQFFLKKKDLEIINAANTYRYKLFEQKSNSVVNKIKAEVLTQIKINLIPATLDYITKDLNQKVIENYSERDLVTGITTPHFKAKAFLLADDQRMADEIAKHIKKVSNGTNIINGFKFGLDYSDQSKEGDIKFIDSFNIIKYGNTIKDDFDSQEPESTDILIIVGKYLMGYDNKRLVAVYCNTNISEPSRIFQLYTRPATKLDKKEIGFFIDMCFDNQNYDTYKRALAWYETGNENSVLFLEEEQIENQRKNLDNYINKLVHILKMTKEDLLKVDKERNLFTHGVNEDEQNEIFSICKGIHLTIRNLISPRYYRDYLPYILTINKALWGLLSYLKANKKEPVFTKKDIELLFHEFMKTLKINNINEIMEIEILNGNFIKQVDAVPAKETIISKQLYQVKNLLDKNRDFMHSDIFNKLRMMAENIEADNQWDVETEKKTTELLKQGKKELENIKEKIDNNFESQQEWFVTYTVMKNYLESLDVNIEDESVFKKFTKRISEVIKRQINNNSRSGILMKNETLIETIRASFSDSAADLISEGINVGTIMNIYHKIGSDENKLNGTILSDMLIEQIQIKKNEF